jgi:MFS transporter, PAT family, beta-lactamase induction signal transducer AmpG
VLHRPRAAKVALLTRLALLYFAQGLPFGFQSTALPVYLRKEGVSLAAIGFTSALALPWLGKPLWAPLVDRFGSTRFGRRKSWIVPLQLLLALTCALAARTPVSAGGTAPLLALVFLMNLFAATQDIAVDGLAIDILGRGELGLANAVQVVGYKAGMLTGGGLLVWASGRLGWQGLFGIMAALELAMLLAVLPLREPSPQAPATASVATGASATGTSLPVEERSLAAVVATLVHALRQEGAGALMLFVGTYKIGESMVDGMWKPFLVDAGFSAPQIGLWIGTYGLVASLAGSLAGGLLATRRSLLFAVAVAAALRSTSMLGEWLVALAAPPSAGAVIAVTVTEHFFGGALTTVMFAFMMSRVDKTIGATHYTLLASVEVLGKTPGAWLSGVLAARLGYARLFALGVTLSFAFLLMLAPMRRGAQGPALRRAADG